MRRHYSLPFGAGIVSGGVCFRLSGPRAARLLLVIAGDGAGGPHPPVAIATGTPGSNACGSTTTADRLPAPHPVPLPACGERESGLDNAPDPLWECPEGAATLPLPACGERVGVRGTAPASSHRTSAESGTR
jgi:hypothetical protein